MTTLSRKGRAGLRITTAFIQSFPLPADHNKPQTISVGQFDLWLMQAGYMASGISVEERNSIRNRLRNKINFTAASDYWKDQLGNEPFHVIVLHHGINYSIERTHRALDIKEQRLPPKLRGWVAAQKATTGMLAQGTDFPRMPPAQRAKVQRDQHLYQIAFDSCEAQLLLAATTLENTIRVIQGGGYYGGGGSTPLLSP